MKLRYDSVTNKQIRYFKKFECQFCKNVFLADDKSYFNLSDQQKGPMFKTRCPECYNQVYNTSNDSMALYFHD